MNTRAKVSSSRSELGTRLATVIGRYPTKKRASEVAGVTVEQLGRYIAGEAKPSLEVVARLAVGAGFSLDWVATGIGPISGNPELTRASWGPGGQISVRFFDAARASAGPGALIEAETSRLVSFDEAMLHDLAVSSEHLAMMAADGESMEPTIRSGELMLFDMSEEARRPKDGIYIVRLEGTLMVKRLQPLPGHAIRIINDNAAFQPFVVKLDEGTDFAIIARVVVIFRHV